MHSGVHLGNEQYIDSQAGVNYFLIGGSKSCGPHLEEALLNPARGLGSVVSSPSGVWCRAPAEIEFGAF